MTYSTYIQTRKRTIGHTHSCAATQAGRGILLSWLSSKEATPEAVETVSIFFEEVTKFDSERQHRLVSTFAGRMSQRARTLRAADPTGWSNPIGFS